MAGSRYGTTSLASRWAPKQRRIMSTAHSQGPESALEVALARLDINKDRWARTTLEDRIGILLDVKDGLQAVASDWAQEAARQKQIPDGSPLEGEEWISGPYAVMAACNALIQTLSHMQGKAFLDALPVRDVSADQIAVRVLPHFDLGSPVAQWHQEPMSGCNQAFSRENLHNHVATAYNQLPEEREGSVSLVLGAGNIASIAPLDCFQKLFTEHAVVLLKLKSSQRIPRSLPRARTQTVD